MRVGSGIVFLGDTQVQVREANLRIQFQELAFHVITKIEHPCKRCQLAEIREPDSGDPSVPIPVPRSRFEASRLFFDYSDKVVSYHTS